MNIEKTALLMAICLTVAISKAQSVVEMKKAIDAEQFVTAKNIAKALIIQKPAEAENYLYLGNVYIKLGYLDSARAVFSSGISTDPKYALNYVGLGEVSLNEKKSEQANTDFEQAISITRKKDYQTYLHIGKAYTYALKPDYTKAISYLQKAKEINEKVAEIYLTLGDAYRGMKNNSAAYTNYTSAFELDKSLLRAKIALGVIIKQAKSFKESSEEFNKILTVDPNYAPAYRELAETYYLWANAEPKMYTTRINQALGYYRKYMDLTDHSLDSRMRYADFLILAKKYKALELEAQAMAKIEKTNKRILRYLGYSAYENGNYTIAAEALTEFINHVDSARIIPRDYLYLGKTFIETGKIAEAVSSFEKAASLDSSVTEQMAPLAKRLFTSKNYEEAARLYELALKNPKSKSIAYDNFYLGMSHYFAFAAQVKSSNDSNIVSTIVPDSTILVKADSAFSKVITLSPKTPDSYLYRARIKRILDDKENPKGLMVPDYEKYIELITAKPNFATSNSLKLAVIEAYSYLGAFSAKSDENKAEAKEYFDKIIELDPDNEYATSSLKFLNSN